MQYIFSYLFVTRCDGVYFFNTYHLLALRSMPVSKKITFGERLRHRRQELNIKSIDLAARVGGTPGSITQWERGVNNPSGVHMFLLARYLNCSMDWLVLGEGEPQDGLYSAAEIAFLRAFRLNPEDNQRAIQQLTAAGAVIDDHDRIKQKLATMQYDYGVHTLVKDYLANSPEDQQTIRRFVEMGASQSDQKKDNASEEEPEKQVIY